MKIAMVHGPDDLRLDEVGEPEAGLDEVVATLATGDASVDAMISHQVEWDDLRGAFALARDPATAVKVVVKFPGFG